MQNQDHLIVGGSGWTKDGVLRVINDGGKFKIESDENWTRLFVAPYGDPPTWHSTFVWRKPMQAIDYTIKECSKCHKAVTLREALIVETSMDTEFHERHVGFALGDDTLPEKQRITEDDIVSGKEVLTNVFYPIAIAITFSPVVCLECYGNELSTEQDDV